MHYTLKHSGIKGQKWGHRNGPPYPLKASDHSASEKKSGTKGWTAKAKKEQKKKVSEMSDAELKTAIERKRLENRYRSLKSGSTGAYDTIKRVTNSAGEFATERFGKKSPETKVIRKVGDLEEKANNGINKSKGSKVNRDIHKMSNEELKRESERLQLEKDYKDLNPDKIQRGIKAAATIIETGVTIYVIAKNASSLINKGKAFIDAPYDNMEFGRLDDDYI